MTFRALRMYQRQSAVFLREKYRNCARLAIRFQQNLAPVRLLTGGDRFCQHLQCSAGYAARDRNRYIIKEANPVFLEGAFRQLKIDIEQ